VDGSPKGQRHMDSRKSIMVTRSEIGMTTSDAGRTLAWGSIIGCMARAVLPRDWGVGRVICGRSVGLVMLRLRGAGAAASLSRPERPRRCTFPITALRVMAWPNSAAIWLALWPSNQSFSAVRPARLSRTLKFPLYGPHTSETFRILLRHFRIKTWKCTSQQAK